MGRGTPFSTTVVGESEALVADGMGARALATVEAGELMAIETEGDGSEGEGIIAPTIGVGVAVEFLVPVLLGLCETVKANK